MVQFYSTRGVNKVGVRHTRPLTTWISISFFVHCSVSPEPQPPVTEPVLVDLFLWKHIVRGIDAVTMRVTYVSIDALYIIAKFPANDPLVMLQRMAENRTKLSTILTHTINHRSSTHCAMGWVNKSI
jgi:hypothetical protein